MNIKQTRGMIVTDIGINELRVGRKVDRVIEMPWDEFGQSEYWLDKITKSLSESGLDERVIQDGVGSIIGEDECYSLVDGVYQDKERGCLVSVYAVWDTRK